MRPPCPFCQPALQAGVFFEASDCVGVVDIAPIVPGHALVLPRRHVSRLLDLAAADYDALFRTVRQVARLLMAIHNASAVDISVQDGAAAGQTVDHVHVHVIPRRMGDLPAPGGWFEHLADSAHRRRLTCEELRQAVAFITSRRRELGL